MALSRFSTAVPTLISAKAVSGQCTTGRLLAHVDCLPMADSWVLHHIPKRRCSDGC
jgi:uncharacterized membrane protein